MWLFGGSKRQVVAQPSLAQLRILQQQFPMPLLSDIIAGQGPDPSSSHARVNHDYFGRLIAEAVRCEWWDCLALIVSHCDLWVNDILIDQSYQLYTHPNKGLHCLLAKLQESQSPHNILFRFLITAMEDSDWITFQSILAIHAAQIDTLTSQERFRFFRACVHLGEVGVDFARVLIAKSLHLNPDTGECDPSIGTFCLADDAITALFSEQGFSVDPQHAMLVVSQIKALTEQDIPSLRKILSLLSGNYHCSVDIADQDDNTPTHYAAQQADPTVSELLLQHCLRRSPLQAKAANQQGQSPLHCARNVAAVNCLLAAGADPLQRDENESTPLHTIAGRNNTRMLRSVLTHIGTTNCAGLSDNDRMTPLHLAAQSLQRIDFYRSLARICPAHHAQNKEGLTPVMCALRHGNTAIIEYYTEQWNNDLQAMRQHCSLTDFHRRHLLHWAAKGCHDPATATRLVALIKKFYPFKYFNAPDANGRRPMHYACRSGNLAMVRALLVGLYPMDKFLLMSSVDRGGKTPLDYAKDLPDDMIKRLLEHEVRLLDTSGSKPQPHPAKGHNAIPLTPLRQHDVNGGEGETRPPSTRYGTF